MVTLAPARNDAPVIVNWVPPPVGPVFGLTDETPGAGWPGLGQIVPCDGVPDRSGAPPAARRDAPAFAGRSDLARRPGPAP